VLSTKLTLRFLGTAVERVVLRKGAWLPRSFTLNALRKRLRRLIFCTSGDPLCIVFGEADPPLASVLVQFVAQATQRRSRLPLDHASHRGIKASAVAWDGPSVSAEPLALVSVWE
jgi:predicted component of type VI protein secretion system